MGEKTRAVLVKIVEGEFPYLVFRVSSLPGQSVTVSRKDWTDTDPRVGTEVVLSDLVRFEKGWRALKARYLKPDD